MEEMPICPTSERFYNIGPSSFPMEAVNGVIFRRYQKKLRSQNRLYNSLRNNSVTQGLRTKKPKLVLLTNNYRRIKTFSDATQLSSKKAA